jgi:hypothetical protein
MTQETSYVHDETSRGIHLLHHPQKFEQQRIALGLPWLAFQHEIKTSTANKYL